MSEKFINVRIAVLIILMSGILIGGCEKKGLYYYPEDFANYLELNSDQREEVLPKLIEIQDKIIVFYEKWYGSLGRQGLTPIIRPDSLLNNAKLQVREFIHTKANEILPLLSPKQQEKLSSVRIPELGIREILTARRDREMVKAKEFSGFKKIALSEKATIEPITEGTYNEILESRTIIIGNRRFNRSSLGKVTRGFPLVIRATIFDDGFKKVYNKWNNLQNSGSTTVAAETGEDENNLQIKITLSTYYHESYLNIERWIVFLETGSGIKIEPLRIEKNDEPFIPVEDDPYESFSMDPRQWTGTDTTHNTTRRSPRDQFRAQQAHYTLYFPSEYEEESLIGIRRGDLNLIFLDEINGEDKAEGGWKFEPSFGV